MLYLLNVKNTEAILYVKYKRTVLECIPRKNNVGVYI